MMELVGPIPHHMALQGKHSRDFFNHRGELIRIHKLRYWGLADVLKDKYHYPSMDAKEIAAFLGPMLEVDPGRR
jgi:hypothetical protein